MTSSMAISERVMRAIHGRKNKECYRTTEFDYLYLFDSRTRSGLQWHDHDPRHTARRAAQLTTAGMSSLLTPGNSQDKIASLIASMAGMRVKLLRQASTTRRSGMGSSNGT